MLARTSPIELTAVAYRDGVETGRFTDATAAESLALSADADRTELSADGRVLACVDYCKSAC